MTTQRSSYWFHPLVIFILEATSVEVQLQTDALAKHRTALIKRASKLTMGQSLTVMMAHQVQICLRSQRPPMDDVGQLIKYWTILTDMPEIIRKICQKL